MLIKGGAILWLIALLSTGMIQTSLCYEFEFDRDRAKNCEPKQLEKFRKDGQKVDYFRGYYDSFGDHTSICIKRKIDALNEQVKRQLDSKYYRALIEFHESMGKVRRKEPDFLGRVRGYVNEHKWGEEEEKKRNGQARICFNKWRSFSKQSVNGAKRIETAEELLEYGCDEAIRIVEPLEPDLRNFIKTWTYMDRQLKGYKYVYTVRDVSYGWLDIKEECSVYLRTFAPSAKARGTKLCI